MGDYEVLSSLRGGGPGRTIFSLVLVVVVSFGISTAWSVFWPGGTDHHRF